MEIDFLFLREILRQILTTILVISVDLSWFNNHITPCLISKEEEQNHLVPRRGGSKLEPKAPKLRTRHDRDYHVVFNERFAHRFGS